MPPRFAIGDIVSVAKIGNRGTVKSFVQAGTSWFYCVHPLDFVEDGPDGFFEFELKLVKFI
jgi:hypothetical protein